MWLAYVTRTLKHDHKAWDLEPVLTAKAWVKFLQEARKLLATNFRLSWLHIVLNREMGKMIFQTSLILARCFGVTIPVSIRNFQTGEND